MEPRSLAYIAAACGGELVYGSPEEQVTRICTDSRKVSAGDLFLAIRGERFDGHEFILAAGAAGARGVVCERAKAPAGPIGCPVILVEDTRAALGRLAARYRQDFKLPIIAVAGSNGKTTTKELLAGVLRTAGPCLWSEASFNNDIGVPVTLLNLNSSHRAAVLEAGTNHPGELAPLVRMIQPQIGVLTSIGREHLEYFGDVAGVAQEEGWLAELLPIGGTLCIHGDSEWAPGITQRCRARVVRVGWDEGNEWRVEHVALTETGTVFQVRAPTSEFCGEYRLSLVGRHQALNATFALAVAAELKLNARQAREGLAVSRAPKLRSQLWETRGFRVLDDSYNANADSVTAALETLRDLPCAGRRVAVLGDMAELGQHTVASHREIGEKAGRMNLDLVIGVGRWASETVQGATSAGLAQTWIFPDVNSAAGQLRQWLAPGDLVLLKGSRLAGLERLGELLRQGPS